jgi:hypothetical protein
MKAFVMLKPSESFYMDLNEGYTIKLIDMATTTK